MSVLADSPKDQRFILPVVFVAMALLSLFPPYDPTLRKPA
jgi:hypothetical protein